MSPSALTYRAHASPDTPRNRGPWVNGFLALFGVLSLLPRLPFLTLRFVFCRPPGAAYGWFLKSHLIKSVGQWTGLAYPETDAEATAVPRPIAPFGNVMKLVTMDVVRVPAAPEEWCVGYAEPAPIVPRAERPGFILSPPGAALGTAKAVPGEKLVFYIHGGAYARGHPMWSPFAPKLARDTHTRVFGVQYRKCLTDSTAYPAPLLDALAAWHYVTVHLGFTPSNIVVTGDSAGAHLALALVLQLSALDLPLPGSLALASPWVDFTTSFASWKRNQDDYLTKSRLDNCIKSIVRHYNAGAVRHPLFSPALADAGHWTFLVSVPVFVSYGTLEALEDEDKALVDGMRRDGVAVEVFEDKGGFHDGPITGMNEDVYKRFAAGIEDQLKQIAIKATTDGQ